MSNLGDIPTEGVDKETEFNPHREEQTGPVGPRLLSANELVVQGLIELYPEALEKTNLSDQSPAAILDLTYFTRIDNYDPAELSESIGIQPPEFDSIVISRYKNHPHMYFFSKHGLGMVMGNYFVNPGDFHGEDYIHTSNPPDKQTFQEIYESILTVHNTGPRVKKGKIMAYEKNDTKGISYYIQIFPPNYLASEREEDKDYISRLKKLCAITQVHKKSEDIDNPEIYAQNVLSSFND